MSASKDPVPGGGGVCGAVGSLAAALGEMGTNLTIGKKKYLEYTFELTDIRKELEILRINLLGCINKDAEAFEPLAKAYSLPKDSEGYEEKMEACLKTAADSPLLILKYAVRVIELDERLAKIRYAGTRYPLWFLCQYSGQYQTYERPRICGSLKQRGRRAAG